MREKLRQIIYRGQCIDNDDPMRLGRIRAILKTDNVNNTEQSVDYTPWSYNDPFVFLPLLPFFINTPPKPDEYVHLFYSNLDSKTSKDRFYVPGVYSSPTTSYKETYESSITNLDLGSRNKKFQDIKDKKISEGVYANPEDVAIYGRGSADIIIKENTVILRAGKNKKFNRKSLPVVNNRRAFIQLSKFEQRTTKNDEETKLRFLKNDDVVKTLIEYTVNNLENESNNFQGSIYISNLVSNNEQSKKLLRVKDMTIDKDIPGTMKVPLTEIKFNMMSIDDVIDLINRTLKTLTKTQNINDLVDDTITNISIVSALDESLPGQTIFDNLFPFYYRPLPLMYNKKNVSGETNIKARINKLLSNVRASESIMTKGYSLIVGDDFSTTVPLKPRKEKVVTKNIEPFDKSVGIVGADSLYLLSYESQKVGTDSKINFENTIYGIDENKVAEEIEEKTSSLVRGEELFELINLIVKFLVSHVHPFPGEAPIPVSLDNTRVDDIIKELRNASEKVLNKKIRIN
jgi:hypothetical protein